MKTADKLTTWQRTKTPGLLRHKGGRFYGRFTLAGKTKFIPLETDLLEIARTRFAEHKARVERTRKAARSSERGSSTMADLVELYKARIKERRGIAESTRNRYLEHAEYIGRTWPGFGQLRPDELTRDAVERWRNRALAEGSGFKPPGAKKVSDAVSGKSAGTFNKSVDALRQMIDIAVGAGALHANPLRARGIKAPDTPKKPKLPEREILHAVFDDIEKSGGIAGQGVECADFCRGLTFTGCRKSELAAIAWQDVDFTRGIVRVHGSKTDAAEREVPLIPAARSLFARILDRRKKAATMAIDSVPHVPAEARVFKVAEATKSLTRACAAVGCIRLTHHDLRDAFITQAIEAGVDVPTIAAWAGHVDGGALLMKTYAHHRRAHSVAQAAKVNF